MRMNLKFAAEINGKNYLLSTVELPYYSSSGQYESMVFAVSKKGLVNYDALYVRNYYLVEEAQKQHEILVDKMKHGVKFWDYEA